MYAQATHMAASEEEAKVGTIHTRRQTRRAGPCRRGDQQQSRAGTAARSTGTRCRGGGQPQRGGVGRSGVEVLENVSRKERNVRVDSRSVDREKAREGRAEKGRTGTGWKWDETSQANECNCVLCHQNLAESGRGTVLYNRLQDAQSISPAPRVAKFKPGNGVSRTEIHRGSREATASHSEPLGKGGRQDGVAQWVPCCRYVSLGTGPMVIEDLRLR